MARWLLIAGLWPLMAAGGVHAQQALHLGSASAAPVRPLVRSFDLGPRRELAGAPFAAAADGLIGRTQIAPNTSLGFGLITLSRPKLGPESRSDGRPVRSRRPAVSFTFRF